MNSSFSHPAGDESEDGEEDGSGGQVSEGSREAELVWLLLPVGGFSVSRPCRYFQYKRLWDVFKLPGEADRTALRLEMKVPDTHTH